MLLRYPKSPIKTLTQTYSHSTHTHTRTYVHYVHNKSESKNISNLGLWTSQFLVPALFATYVCSNVVRMSSVILFILIMCIFSHILPKNIYMYMFENKKCTKQFVLMLPTIY